jgi:hypothetical protein
MSLKTKLVVIFPAVSSLKNKYTVSLELIKIESEPDVATAEKSGVFCPKPALFTHIEYVNLLLLPAELGVLFKYALSALLNLSDLEISKSPAAPAVVARNSGLAAPGILMKRSAAK